MITVPTSPEDKHLYDSYNVATASVSKTYTPGGTHHQQMRGRLFGRAAVQNVPEHPMLDIVMLALAFGFFAAGIGYAYACERL